MLDENDPWNLDRKKSSKNKAPDNSSWNALGKVIDEVRRTIGTVTRNGSVKPYLAILILLSLYACTGFYIVHPSEEGIELTFGRYSNTETSGLRYHFPYPIGKVFKVNVKEVNREEIGMGSSAYSKDTDRGEGVMLTGDENIVNVNFEVQWRVRDAKDYLFKVRDHTPGFSVKNAAESAMREIIGRNTISFALGQGRQEIPIDTRTLLQQILDGYQMGIEILSVQMKKIDPPEKVINSFRDVQSARADKERTINEAYAYSNDIIPRAKGEAIKIRLDAEAYESEVVNEAKGNANRFLSLYEEYRQNPSLVKSRIYLETMENILSKVEKLVITDDLKGMFSYLPLSDFKK